jgi:hypothetical protein
MPFVLARNTPVTLAQTLGSILTSLVEAQAQSARTTVEFVNEVGFVTDPVDATERVRMVQFRYHKLDENGVRSEFQVEIPLLGMMEIPLISIQRARIEFDYNVTSTGVPPASETPVFGPFKPLTGAIIKGTIAPRSSTEGSERASLKVTVEIERAGLPIGLERTLNMLEVATSEEKREPS